MPPVVALFADAAFDKALRHMSTLFEERAVLGLCNTLEEILIPDSQIVDEPLRNDVFACAFGQWISAEQTASDIHQRPLDHSGKEDSEDEREHSASFGARF